MKPLLRIGAILLCATQFLSIGWSQKLTVGPNVNITQLTGNEAEPSIAINRKSPDEIFVSTVVLGVSRTVQNATSLDGGQTWNFNNSQSSNPGLTPSCCDPWSSADRHGNIFHSYIDTTKEKAVVTLSTDSGSSFSEIWQFGADADHPEMAAGRDSVWITFQDEDRVVAAGAPVNGLGDVGNFAPPQQLVGSGNKGDIAVGPNGQVFATFMSPAIGLGPSEFRHHFDPDGLGPMPFMQTPTFSSNVGGDHPIPAQPLRAIDAQIDLEYASNGRLFALYTDASDNTTVDTDIVIRTSDDDGATWTEASRINDDGTGNSQFFGRLAVDEVTGALAAIWFDTRNSPSNERVQLWGSASVDGGETWLPNIQISEGTWSGRNENIGSEFEMLDYIALDFHDGVFHAVWPDASNITGDNPDRTRGLDLYTARVTLTVPEPAGLELLVMLTLLSLVLQRENLAR